MAKVIINLGDKEFSHGLVYTAITRVRRLADLTFSPTPTFDRFKSVFRTARFREQRDEERRKRTHKSTTQRCLLAFFPISAQTSTSIVPCTY